MSVHYKFKSGKDAHTITFDGLHISVGELKKAIMQQRKIGKSTDLDLQITNAQTKEVYENNSVLIPKNTSVIVARVPVANTGHKKAWNKNTAAADNTSNKLEIKKPIMEEKPSNISSEDDKIKEMFNMLNKDYDPSKYPKGKGPMGPLPPNYTCYRCGNRGHYIKNCPTNNMDMKRSTGIPRSFMIPANPDQKGAMITANGDYAVPIIDHDAYKEIKKEKPPFSEVENTVEQQQPKIEIPEDFICSLCKNLLQDAVLIPCCGNSFCDECIRHLLVDSENHECPICHERDVSPNTLIPNRFLRISVGKFKNESGCNTVAKKIETKAENVDGDQPQTNIELESVKNNEIKQSEQEQQELKNDESELTSIRELTEASINADDKQDSALSDKDDLYAVDDPGKNNIDDNNEESMALTNKKIDEDIEKSPIKNTNDEKSLIPQNDNKTTTTTNDNSSSMEQNQLPVIGLSLPQQQQQFNFSNYNRFRNSIRVRSSGQHFPPMFRPTNSLMLPHRMNQNRTLMPDSTPFFPDHTQMPPTRLPPLPLPPYPGSTMIRNPFDLYNHAPINPLVPFPNNLNSMGTLNGRTMPMLEVDNPYLSFKYHDDYEDKFERFNRQLELRSKRYRDRDSSSVSRRRNSRSRSRSRSSSNSSNSSERSRRSSHRRRSPSRYETSSHRRRQRSRSPSASRRSYKSSSYSHRYRKSRSRSHSKYEKRSEYRERSRERYNERDKRHKSSSKRESSHTYRHSSRDRSGDKDESTKYSNRDKYVSNEDKMIDLNVDKTTEDNNNKQFSINDLNNFNNNNNSSNNNNSNSKNISIKFSNMIGRQVELKECCSSNLIDIKLNDDVPIEELKEKGSSIDNENVTKLDTILEESKEETKFQKMESDAVQGEDNDSTKDNKNDNENLVEDLMSTKIKSTATKKLSDDVEIKIQEDYSDLESEDVRTKRNGEKKNNNDSRSNVVELKHKSLSSNNVNYNENCDEEIGPGTGKENIVFSKPDRIDNNNTNDNKFELKSHSKIVKTDEQGKMLISFLIGPEKRSLDSKVSTSERSSSKKSSSKSSSNSSKSKDKSADASSSGSKLKSKINVKETDKEKEKERSKSKHSSSDKKEKKEKSDRSKEKDKDKSKDKHKDHHKSEKSSSSKSSKDKKKDKEERSHKHHSSKKRHHRHRSRSSSSSDDDELPIIKKKKIKSAIDSSSSSKYKSSTSSKRR